jgi:hypothetical protein
VFYQAVDIGTPEKRSFAPHLWGNIEKTAAFWVMSSLLKRLSRAKVGRLAHALEASMGSFRRANTT